MLASRRMSVSSIRLLALEFGLPNASAKAGSVHDFGGDAFGELQVELVVVELGVDR
jgi:hypothetical protein